jgi:DNA polymerase zeta
LRLRLIGGFVAWWVQSGAVLGRKFQPHESHVPYLLQMKVDFNLYGMGFMRLAKVLFRWAGQG